MGTFEDAFNAKKKELGEFDKPVVFEQQKNKWFKNQWHKAEVMVKVIQNQ